MVLCVRCGRCACRVHRALDGRYFKWLPGAQVKCWMRLTLSRLPQLAVSAKILCLLMVVFCGAVPPMVRSMRLYSESASRFLEMYPNGTVLALGLDIPDIKQELTTISVSDDLNTIKILIFSPGAGRFLCFNRVWKLHGLEVPESVAAKMDRCHFYEKITPTGHNMYEWAPRKKRELRHFTCFSRNGKPRKCTQFTKPQKLMFFMKKQTSLIDSHNRIVAETSWSDDRPQAPKPRHRARLAEHRRTGKKVSRSMKEQKHHLRHHRGQKRLDNGKYTMPR